MEKQDYINILIESVEEWNKWREKNFGITPDLSDADFNNKNFKLADFTGCNFSGSNFSGANLSGAKFKGAKFVGSDFSCAIFKNANLEEIDISGANFESKIVFINNNTKKIITDFEGATLTNAKLKGSNLKDANFRGANLINANLENADLTNAVFENADLSYAKIENAIFENVELSGCVLNQETLSFKKIIGCKKGINGIFCSKTNSSALIELNPPGDSMQGSNPDAIVEGLKQARKLHTISLTFACIAILIAVLKPKEIKLPMFTDFQTDPNNFAVFAIILSIGSLCLAESFMRSTLQGVHYITDRDLAMKVAHFPWILTKYENTIWGKLQSIIIRSLLSFHPIVYPLMYLLLIRNSEPYAAHGFYSLDNPYNILYPIECIELHIIPILNNDHYMNIISYNSLQRLISLPYYVIIVYFLLLILSVRIFWLSQKFQKPILFDPKKEKNKKTDFAILNEKVSELVELLKHKS